MYESFHMFYENQHPIVSIITIYLYLEKQAKM